MKHIWKVIGIPAAMLLTAQAVGANDGVLTVTQKLLSERLMVEAAQAAIDACAANNIHVHVVIVDTAGLTRLLLIGDGSKANTIDGALRKAYTAAMMGQATATIAERIAANPKMLLPPDSKMLYLAGGIPIRVGPDLLGAIAVGGGTPEQDAPCAQAGLDKIQYALH
jgi:uncharacterized protein GlcG (DUF336 family)